MKEKRDWIGKALLVLFMIGAMLLYAVPKAAYAAQPRSWTYRCGTGQIPFLFFKITEQKNGYEVRGEALSHNSRGEIKGSYYPQTRRIAARLIWDTGMEETFDGWIVKKEFLVKVDNGSSFTCSSVKKAEQKPMAPQASPVPGEAKFHWKTIGPGDCTGKDTGQTRGSASPDKTKCASPSIGLIAVCWDGQGTKNPEASSEAWCTYKDTQGQPCTGGVHPGILYECTAEP
jgi:hypothetical protein